MSKRAGWRCSDRRDCHHDTQRPADALPGLGILDGSPPSGAASGYVCFDVAALLLAPRLLALRTRLPALAPARS